MGYIDDIRTEHVSTIENSIYFDSIIDSTVIKGIKNRYIKVYEIEDISYRLSDSEGKVSILKNFINLFDNLDNSIGISLLLSCIKNIDEYYIENKVDNLNKLRTALNETINENIYDKGKSNIIKKFICIDITEKNDIDAIKRFKVIDDIIKSSFYEISMCEIKELNTEKLIKLMYFLYNPEDQLTYRENKEMFTESNIKKIGSNIKSVIKPHSLSVFKNYIKINDTYMGMLYLKRTNKLLKSCMLNEILNNLDKSNEITDSLICIKLRQIDKENAIKLARKELGDVEGDIYNYQTKFTKKSISVDLVPRSYKQRRDEALYINDSLMKRDENLYNISMYALVKAGSLEDLKGTTFKFTKRAKHMGLTLVKGTNMQEYIFNSILPYGLNQTPYSLIMDSESLSAFNIFNAVDIIEPDGDYYGKNKLTNNIIKYNIMGSDNYSQLVFGTTGKGKSFTSKLQLLNRVLRSDLREAVILDPSNEWRPIVEEIGGKVIDVKSAGNININLFDIDTAYGDNPLAEKEEFILSVCSLMLRKELTAGQRTTVSIVVNNIYKKWNETKSQNDVPTLHDFTTELKYIIKNKNKDLDKDFLSKEFINTEDIELLKAIMYYSETSNCTIFRGKTKVSLNSKIICFNLKDLGSELNKIAMEVICDLIWLRICRARENHIPTDVIIDEFHLMFNNKVTSSWMAKYWKMLRKYKGCPLGITQNPEDVLSTEDGRNVINNTGFSTLLSLNENDRKLCKDIWKLTNEEIKYITDKPRGEGILIFSASNRIKKKSVIPFINEFKKANYIYKKINTTYDEK